MSDMDVENARSRIRQMNNGYRTTWPGIILCLLFLAGAAFVQCNGCEAGDDESLEAIRGAGLTTPELGGNHWNACAASESSRKFIARNAQGERVDGTVCCGLFAKGCTIRWGGLK